MDRSSEATERARLAGASRLLPYLHLAGLACLAVAQPLLDLLGRTPAFFAVRGLGGGALALLALALVVLPPLPFAALVALADRRDARLGRWALAASVACLVATIALQALRRHVGGWPWLAAGLAAGILAAAAYRRRPALRQAATVLA
ncbi:MAG: hypothetical protein D6696_02570, partial [Acidobacteria bacterium]